MQTWRSVTKCCTQSYPPSKYMKQFISQMQGDTDSTKLLALTWTKGGVMLHAPNAVKLQHTVSAIAYRVETAIADGTAEGAVFCFDGVVTKLHSLRASEAGQMLAEGVNPEDSKMPSFTTHMTYTFQVSVSTYNFTAIRHSPSRAFSMNVTVCQSLTLSTTGSDDDGDDMPDGNPIPVKVETGGSSGEAAFNADTDPVGVRRRRRPTHLPRWLKRRVRLEID
ncbi:hypothetical protein HID58_040453 [Brassica napus]|uniref:Uncharacterized protein n=1 Tax=Brassica napus TaxID=3708 RepID=A0ABQ8B858_BRANA|nr:hypothetical protein HID58_040453 [Brassica napus]